ncbi:MAG TPA: hypothetical protein VGV15_18805 [Terriglobales bacterium]|nr:hypothetical protein [Terriglobales bacterium]
MAFEQAAIKVEKEKEFEELRRAVEGVLSPEKVKRFLKKLRRGRIRIRDFEAVLVCNLMGRADLNTRQLYRSLTLSDQAQIKEFYLSKIEEVSFELRAKFHKLFQYY